VHFIAAAAAGGQQQQRGGGVGRQLAPVIGRLDVT